MSDTLEIIGTIESKIIKWNPTPGEYISPIKYGEKPNFLLGRKSGETYKCEIGAEIHITSLETTFILDTEVFTPIEFKPSAKSLQDDLYQVYCKAWMDWRMKIITKSNDDLGFMIVIGLNPLSLPEVLPLINRAIEQSRTQSN